MPGLLICIQSIACYEDEPPDGEEEEEEQTSGKGSDEDLFEDALERHGSFLFILLPGKDVFLIHCFINSNVHRYLFFFFFARTTITSPSRSA